MNIQKYDKPIKIFYHLYIPPDMYSVTWVLWVDQQLGLLKQLRLFEHAEIYMTITMPMYWQSAMEWPFKLNNENLSVISYDYCLFYEKVIEYINLRYSFVKILDIRDTGEENIYEGECLRFIHEMSKHEDAYYLYFHSKGISKQPITTIHSWRELLDYIMINNWETCISVLKTHDVAVVIDAAYDTAKNTGTMIVPSGNYWWANSEYIRSLPNPVLSDEYMNDEDAYTTGVGYRYAFERWLMVNKPSVGILYNTKTCHYDNLLFVEDIKICDLDIKTMNCIDNI